MVNLITPPSSTWLSPVSRESTVTDMIDTIALMFDRSPLAAEAFYQRRLIDIPDFAPIHLRDDVRLIAQRAWLDRARSEYVGVMILKRFWGLLVDVNAPMDLQELALRMLLDEQRHTHLCIAAAESLGADPEISFDVSELQQARSQASVTEQLLEMIVQTFAIGEATALGLIRFAISDLPGSAYRDILKTIAGDEVLHGRIGVAILTAARAGQTDAWLPWPGDERVDALARPYLNSMAARDVIATDEAILFKDPEAARQLRAVGIPDSETFKSAYHQALDKDVAKGFRRLGVWRSDHE